MSLYSVHSVMDLKERYHFFSVRFKAMVTCGGLGTGVAGLGEEGKGRGGDGGMQ